MNISNIEPLHREDGAYRNWIGHANWRWFHSWRYWTSNKQLPSSGGNNRRGKKRK